MVSVEMSTDIRKFEAKFLGPFTMRQTIAVGISCTYGVPLFFLLGMLPFLDLKTRFLITALLMVPTIICGWVDIYGMKFEIFIVRFIYQTILCPTKRKAKNKNPWKEMYRELKKKELQGQECQNSNTTKSKIKQKKEKRNVEKEQSGYKSFF